MTLHLITTQIFVYLLFCFYFCIVLEEKRTNIYDRYKGYYNKTRNGDS